jgi:survival-of-motor-neuron-related-splicing factor 30
LDELIASGEADAETAALKPGAEQDIRVTTKKLEQLRRDLAELEATLPQSAAPTAPKFDPEKHPLLKKATEKLEPAKPVVFTSGSVCEAQWVDRAWYKATVLTVLGSSSDPKYHVRFAEYEETATVDRHAIRPIYNEKKRKAEAAPAPPPAPTAPSSPYVISGPASINPSAVAAKKEAVPENATPANRRVIGSRKALERKGQEWKKFLSKGPGKQVAKKDSMFRSGTGVNSRGNVSIFLLQTSH